MTTASKNQKAKEYFWAVITTETFYGGPYATEGVAKYRDAHDPDARSEIQKLKDAFKAQKDGHWAEISTVDFLGRLD